MSSKWRAPGSVARTSCELQRRERSAATGNPEDHYAFLDGRQVAFVTNNGNTDPTRTDYYQGIRTAEEWQSQPNPSDPQFQNESFRWATTGGVTDSLLGPGSGYDPLNPATGAGGNSRYTVQAGDTLQGIASAVWGDSSLWYLIADANGLSGGEALQAGQALSIPGKVTNIHNNAGTFRVYDPNKALGDLSPTAPKPAKSNYHCGSSARSCLRRSPSPSRSSRRRSSARSRRSPATSRARGSASPPASRTSSTSRSSA